MLSSHEIKAELKHQEDGDEIAVKQFVKDNKGEIKIVATHIEAVFPNTVEIKPDLCGQTYRASTWHNLRASMLKQGRFIYE